MDVSWFRAMLMIIQCPQCGFSGRIPNSALGRSQLATCPICRCRFSLRASSSTASPAHPRASAAADRPGDDPNSSSYELRAMTWESDAEDDAFPAEILAGEATHDTIENSRREHELLDVPGETAFQPAELAATTTGPLLSASPGSDVGQRGVEPWYRLLLQIWGVVLLVWATFILGRDLLRTNLSGQGPSGNGDLISTVISVLLLVAGAASLFLAVDYSRSLHAGLRPPGASQTGMKTAFRRALASRLRKSWRWPARTAQPARS